MGHWPVQILGGTLAAILGGLRLVLLFSAVAAAPVYATEHNLKVGVYDLEPLVFVDESGRPTGLFIDILEHIAEREKWKLSYVKGTWAQSVSRLESGEIDLLVSVSYSEERTKRLDYSAESIATDWGLVYRRKDDRIESIFDLDGAKISAVQRGIYTGHFKDLAQQFDVKVDLVERENYAQVIEDVESGISRAGIGSNLIGIVLEQKAQVARSGIVFAPIKVMFAVRKGNARDIIQAIDRHVAGLKADRNSVYYAAVSRWLGGRTDQEIPAWIKTGFLGAGLAFIALIGFSQILRHQVRVRTARLARTMAQYRHVIDTTTDLVTRVDTEGSFTFINEASREVLGVSPEEALGLSAFDFIHPEDRAKTRADFQKWLASEEPVFRHQNRLVSRNGTCRSISWSISKDYDLDGKTVGFTSFGHDITENTELERQLREAGELYRSVIATSHDGFWIVDDKGKIVEANEAYARRSGYGRAELTAKHVWDIEAVDDLEIVAARIEKIKRTGGDLFVSRHRAKSGELWDVEVSISYAPVQGGRIFCFFRDIGERLMADRERQDAEKRLRDFLAGSPLIAWMKDEEGRYVFVNDNYLRLIGREMKDMIGKSDADLWPAGYAAEIRARDIDVLQGGHQIEFTERTENKSGREKWWLKHKFPYADSAGRRYVGGVAIDITERTFAEEALRQSQRMAAIGQLTGGVAHDFNNLLAVIMLHLEGIKSELPPGSPLAKRAETALLASEKGANLTQKLLAYSRRQPLKPETFDLGVLIRQMMPLLASTCGEGITIVPQLSAAPLPVFIDRPNLENAILNIVGNARDAMPKGGEISITTRLGKPPIDKDSASAAIAGEFCAVVSITDSGVGMDAKCLRQAVEPFFTTKDVGKGSGLGLSMVQGFVTQSNGWLDIRSKLGEGTTVSLFLPLSRQAVKPSPPEASAVNLAARYKILVLEDNAEVRDAVVSMLSAMGCDVAGVGSIAAAREKLANTRDFEIMLSDVVLPGGEDGLSFAREIRAARPDISIILMSGHSDVLAGSNVSAEKFVFLGKPFNRAALATALNQIERPAQ